MRAFIGFGLLVLVCLAPVPAGAVEGQATGWWTDNEGNNYYGDPPSGSSSGSGSGSGWGWGGSGTGSAPRRQETPEEIAAGESFRQGRDAEKRGEDHAAIDSYDRALRLNPTLDGAWNNLGGCLMRIGDYARAEECFREAVRLNPDPRFKKNLKALRQWRAQQESEAREALRAEERAAREEARKNAAWLKQQQQDVRRAAKGNAAWRREVLQAIRGIEVPSPETHRPRKMEDLRPGDILLVVPEGALGKSIVGVDYLTRVANDLAQGEVFKSFRQRKAPASHALAVVKEVNGRRLYLDHTKEGSRILNEEEVRSLYSARGIYVARPQRVVDGKVLWDAARQAALREGSDFGLFGESAVCSERAALAVAKATGSDPFDPYNEDPGRQRFDGRRLGPVDVTPGDFFDSEGKGKYFIVSPLEFRPKD